MTSPGMAGRHALEDTLGPDRHHRGREAAVVTGKLDHDRAGQAGECHGSTVGELSLRRRPGGDHNAPPGRLRRRGRQGP